MNLQTKWLQQLVKWCEVGQKQYAWNRAKQLAEICPDQLSELPAQLTEAMQSQSTGTNARNAAAKCEKDRQ